GPWLPGGRKKNNVRLSGAQVTICTASLKTGCGRSPLGPTHSPVCPVEPSPYHAIHSPSGATTERTPGGRCGSATSPDGVTVSTALGSPPKGPNVTTNA